MKRLMLSSVLALTMALSVVSAGTAAPPKASKQSGGAAGVVAAVIQVDRTLNELQVLSNIGTIEVVTVKDSLNNVLRSARFLNNITILRNFLNNADWDCSVVAVCDAFKNFLNNNTVDLQIADVIAIDILSGGDITIFRSA